MSKWKSLGVIYFVLSTSSNEAWARETAPKDVPASQATLSQGAPAQGTPPHDAKEPPAQRSRSYVQIGASNDPGSLIYSRGAADASAAAGAEIVYLHGMCGHTASKCASVGESSTAAATVYCPQATAKCDGGGFSWAGDAAKQSRELDAQVSRVPKGASVDASKRVIVGFSLGGFSALHIARHSKGVMSLVIVGARIRTSAAELRTIGVKRIVLAAGEHDMVASDMRALAADLMKHGFPAKFVSLGKIGHDFPSDYRERMRDPMRWAETDGKDAPEGAPQKPTS